MTVSRGIGIESVADPATGEVIRLAGADARELAAFVEHARDAKASLTEQIAAVSLELHQRLDASAKWTMQAEEFEIRGESPTRVTYSASLLWETLQQLVRDRLISEAAAGAACDRNYTYTARPSGVNNLKKLGGAVAEAIARCATPIDPLTRRVTVRRKGMVE